MIGSSQFLLQYRRKLVCKHSPVLLSHLVLEAMQDLETSQTDSSTHTLEPGEEHLVKGLPQVISRGVPRGHSITEEHKVLEDALRVHTDHCTDPTKSRVFLFVVPDGAECLAPHRQELGQERGNLNRTNQPQPPNGDRCILQQGFWRVLYITI